MGFGLYHGLHGDAIHYGIISSREAAWGGNLKGVCDVCNIICFGHPFSMALDQDNSRNK